MSKKKNKKNYNYNRNTSLVVVDDKETKMSETKDTSTSKDSSKDKNNTGKTSNSNFGYYYKKKNYDFMGKRNETTFPEFVEICKMKQKELKGFLIDELLTAGYTDVLFGDGYVYAKGTVPVLLTAHMDTVHKFGIQSFYEYYDEEKRQHILSSPQGIGGDDRCGVYMILNIIKTHKCSVLFCEDEEIGGVGSDKFCKTELIEELSNLKYLIELDRANGTDAVFYDCENDDFTKFIEKNTGYKEAWGSFSDIGNLSPACKVASVNLSCGYYNAHTTSEYVIVEEMLHTIEVVKELLNVECEQFEYIEKVYGFGRYGYDYGYGYYGYGYGYGKNKNKRNNKSSSGWYRDERGNYYDYEDDDDDDYENSRYMEEVYERYCEAKTAKKPATKKEDEERTLLIYIVYVDGSERTYVSNGKTQYEAFGKFFIKNPDYCFDDVYDYEYYDDKFAEDGWVSDL